MSLKYLNRSLHTGPYVALCTDEKSFARELKRMKVSPESHAVFVRGSATATTHTLENAEAGTLVSIVCLRPTERPLHQVAGTLAHEATHVWQNHKRHIGEDKPGDEMEAYAIGGLVQRLLKAYLKLNGKTRTKMKK